MSINGNGKILIKKEDIISYKIDKNKDKLIFENILRINNNPFLIKLLNYKKEDKVETIIKFNGYKNNKGKTYIKSASLVEGKNKIEIKNINFDKSLKIEKFDNIDLNYIDKDKKNLIKIYKDKNKYVLKGDYFNSDNLIQNILFSDEETNYFSNDFEIDLDIKKVFLDEEFLLENLSGYLFFKNKKLFDGNLKGYFLDDKKMVFTVKLTVKIKLQLFLQIMQNHL